MRRSYWIILLLVGLVFGGVKLMDWWKHRHLITLDAENAEIYPVLKEVSRQSGIPVLAQTNTTGRVTVHFRQTPVEGALDVLAEQTEGRWEKLFLMGRTDAAIRTLAGDAIEHGPPFLVTRMTGRNLFFADGAAPSFSADPGARIDFKIAGKDLHTASLELALKTQTPIMVEESLNPSLTLQIAEPDLASAVARLAHAAKSKFEMAYHFRTFSRRGRDAQEGSQVSSQSWQERQDARQKLIEQQVALLSPEDQQKYQQQRDERQKRREEWAALTPEERQKKFTEMAAAMAGNAQAQDRFNKRALSRIKNLTPEQRTERYQRFAAAHKK